jgi:hypothetical protein
MDSKEYNKQKYFCVCGEGFRAKINYNKHLKECKEVNNDNKKS